MGQKRRSTRFHLACEAWFGWEEPCAKRREGTGITRDIARSGVFVESVAIPPTSTPLQVIVTLTGRTAGKRRARIAGIGVVRHVQFDNSGPIGFGASVAFHTETPTEEEESPDA